MVAVITMVTIMRIAIVKSSVVTVTAIVAIVRPVVATIVAGTRVIRGPVPVGRKRNSATRQRTEQKNQRQYLFHLTPPFLSPFHF